LAVLSLKAKGELARVELSDGSLFSFKLRYLPPDYPLEEQSEDAFRFASECLRAEKNALRLIAIAEQCTAGLTRKLEKKGHNPACVHAVLDYLTEKDLINDNRYSRLWLESHLTRSPRRLLSSLAAKGINYERASNALKAVLDDENEFTLLGRFAAKHPHDPRALKYVLKNEGFSPQSIGRYFEGS
jgi:regulatory protein